MDIRMTPSPALGAPRIAIFSGTHGHGYGAERVLEHLISAAPKMISTLICPKDAGVAAVASDLGVPVIDWPSQSNSIFDNTRAFARFRLRQNDRSDILHAWHTRGFEWGLALGARFGMPVTGTLHDDPTSTRNSAVRRWLIKTSANRFAALVTVSNALDSVCRGAGWTVPRCVVQNGLPDGNVAVRERNRTDPLKVGFLGLNESWKGLDQVERIVAALSAESVDWELYGEPSADNRPILNRLLQQYPDRVHFHGRCQPSEIYSKLDVILHPSQGFDPYPTVLLEAARAGIPVVASAVGGSVEIVRDGSTGLLVSPKDLRSFSNALIRLARESNLLSSLGTAARERYAAQFHVDQMAERYREFWRAIPHRR
ncbi:MAG: glycosyltransferase family 4 protein [Terrimicrobiaceae bacterium]|nr:glycosyltransferase family 4 protein [Terrimicrobiaceae bacterium]